MLVLAVLVAAAVVGIISLTHHSKSNARVIPNSQTTEGVDIVPGDGQAFVTGTLQTIVGDDVQAPKIPPPFTLTVADRGGGTKAEITGGTVNGKATAVLWDGGRPLPIRGTGALDLGPAHVEIQPTKITWSLDGRLRALDPGTYQLEAAVALGSTGLAVPAESATVVVGSAPAALHTFKGVTLTLPVAPLTLDGPGRLTLTGDLRVQTPTSTRPAHTVTFGPGPFELQISPTQGGWHIDKIVLQGQFTAT